MEEFIFPSTTTSHMTWGRTERYSYQEEGERKDYGSTSEWCPSGLWDTSRHTRENRGRDKECRRQRRQTRITVVPRQGEVRKKKGDKTKKKGRRDYTPTRFGGGERGAGSPQAEEQRRLLEHFHKSTRAKGGGTGFDLLWGFLSGERRR